MGKQNYIFLKTFYSRQYIPILRSHQLLIEQLFDPFLCFNKILCVTFIAFPKHMDPFYYNYVIQIKYRKTFIEN